MVFNGYLTGLSEKYFHKRARVVGRNIILVSMLLIAPGIISFAVKLNDWKIVVIYAGVFTCVMLLTLIPKSKKERKAITPKRITVEDEYIICIAEKYAETRLISDVKLVKDFGEFYELIFPFGKISDKFICQKSLLVNGTLEEFEKLFEGKVVRM